ncbi:MAG TPA: Xaa-Pro peptidase family protein [Thermoanaerobaculia bacterium]|jgi:Xaa-Pro aminopeptidase|nr:Xaa-Pro peptidase family protein [Thermoanaerobaculia bacterium]
MSSADLNRGRDLLAAGLADLGARALVIVAGSAGDPDIAPFARGAHIRDCFVIAPGGAPPKFGYLSPMERGEAAATGLDLLTPEALEVERLIQEGAEPPRFWAEVLAKGLALTGLLPDVDSDRLALAGHAPVGVIHAATQDLGRRGWSFVAGNDLARRFRQEKTEEEIAEIRRVAAGTCAAFHRVAELLANATPRPEGDLHLEGEPLTVTRLRREVARTLAEHGLEQPDGNILAPGEEGAMPHSTGTPDRVLRAGESLVVDLFPKGRLFADCTRTFCVGPPPPPLAAAHEAVRGALAQAHEAARPGVRGWTIQEQTCALLSARGYRTPITHPGTTEGYVHGLGHGVGFELHEFPSFRKHAGAEAVLRPGDVFTLEPGLYQVDEGWAVRLEDLVVLGAEGLENLTPLPYELDPRAWQAELGPSRPDLVPGRPDLGLSRSDRGPGGSDLDPGRPD